MDDRLALRIVDYSGGSRDATSEALALVKHRLPNLASQMRVGVLQHGVEHRPQIAGRTADNLKHLAGRGLLLQRLR